MQFYRLSKVDIFVEVNGNIKDNIFFHVKKKIIAINTSSYLKKHFTKLHINLGNFNSSNVID